MENDLMMQETFCRACGAPLSPDATECARCHVAVASAASGKRISYEILLYVLSFFAVMLALLFVIDARKSYFVAALLQGVLPFIIFLVLAFVVIRFWKRS